jgi:hypothetical protein
MSVNLPAEHGCQDETGPVPQAIFGTKSAGLLSSRPTSRSLRIVTKKSEVAAQSVTSQMTDE